MFDDDVLGSEFFEGLERVDQAIAAAVREGGCGRCGGPVHRGDYARKPRGGARAGAGEGQTRRISFCCGAEGCRRRATPPSLRFLGRRVYLEAAVLVASAVGVALTRAREVRRATGVPAMTVRRWLAWWSGPFVATEVFSELCARFVGGLPRHALPVAIVEKIEGSATARLELLARWLAPLTTRSVADGSRFLRGIS
jgi:hypothetical protein